MRKSRYHTDQHLVENEGEYMLKIGKVMPDPTELRCRVIFP